MRDRTLKPVTPVKKFSIKQEEIDKIREDAHHAQELLDNPFLNSYLSNTKQSILELHAKQLIYDVSETTEANGVKKTIIIPSKKEYTLLAGEYRLADRITADIEQTIQISKEMDEKLKSGELEIKDE